MPIYIDGIHSVGAEEVRTRRAFTILPARRALQTRPLASWKSRSYHDQRHGGLFVTALRCDPS
jgi:hypothetical protein